MFHRSTVALASVFALAGCVGSPPTGPLVEFRDGITPITRPSPCEASYVLRPADNPNAQMAVVHVPEGTRLGFRRERDQTVTAVAPKLVIPLDPGAYVWEVVPGSVPPWKTRAKQEVRQTAKGIGFVAAAMSWFGMESLLEEDDTPKPGSGEPNRGLLPSHYDQKP